MPEKLPLPPISAPERRGRLARIRRLADALGFTGAVEYRHERSRSGGAQYQKASKETEDRIVVFAEAFERDADPDDFSLAAAMAHERGHQLLLRDARVGRISKRSLHPRTEEILASLIGSLLAEMEGDRESLFAKACFDAFEAVEVDPKNWTSG